MNVTQGLSKIKKWIALYIGAVSLILVPLYIKGSYFGLIELKARVFLYTAIPAVLPAAVLAAAEFFFDRGSRHKIVKTSTVLTVADREQRMEGRITHDSGPDLSHDHCFQTFSV